MKRLFGAPLANGFRKLLRNPKYRWLVILGSLFYLVSPLDISPDVLPIVGWIDDGLLATIVVTELTQMVMDKRRNGVVEAGQTVNPDSYENVIDVEAISVS